MAFDAARLVADRRRVPREADSASVARGEKTIDVRALVTRGRGDRRRGRADSCARRSTGRPGPLLRARVRATADGSAKPSEVAQGARRVGPRRSARRARAGRPARRRRDDPGVFSSRHRVETVYDAAKWRTPRRRRRNQEGGDGAQEGGAPPPAKLPPLDERHLKLGELVPHGTSLDARELVGMLTDGRAIVRAQRGARARGGRAGGARARAAVARQRGAASRVAAAEALAHLGHGACGR